MEQERNAIRATGVTDTESPSAEPVSFIEPKPFNVESVSKILAVSERENHWANFGPVSRMLEREIEDYLQLPLERSVVMCCSATAALFALVATKEYQAGRALRWVASAYGFYSSWLGPLADSTVVDCDEHGMLDLDSLKSLSLGSFDGVIVTNIFGGSPDVRPYVEFCRAAGKQLIVDNAVALDGFPRHDGRWSVDEIISFHQTKPWGMGEGGCAIVGREVGAVLRAMTNFGVGLDSTSARGAGNRKISDVSCALILDRLQSIGEWSADYREQARRILPIAEASGFRLLLPLDLDALTPPHLPLLAPSPIPYERLTNEKFVFRKYYLPHSGYYPHAEEIYGRIVNIPCHPGMSAVSNEDINNSLANVCS